MQQNKPLLEYPRPNFVRESFYSLHGEWDYKVVKTVDNFVPGQYDGKIIVPYPIESKASGVCYKLKPNDTLIYHLKFNLPYDLISEKTRTILLHFYGVDQIASVYLNGAFLGEHIGGYTPFSFDIYPFYKKNEENHLFVYVRDYSDTSFYSRGKQSLKSKGIWYTSSSGIYLPVFIETLPNEYLTRIQITSNIDKKCITIIPFATSNGLAKLYLDNHTYFLKTNTENEIKFSSINLWTPDHPYLYEFKIVFHEDVVASYFAFRKFEIKENKAGIKRFFLNDTPIYLNSVLDQGYHPESLLTPISDQQYIDDIMTMKELGFNCLRKHIKIETPRFYYHCDRLGMLVIQDMVNGGAHYNPFVTVLTGFLGISLRDSNYRLFAREDIKGRKLALVEFKEIIKHLYNHPSIIMWTIFNEGWGQFDAAKVYDALRAMDNTRILDHASGWHDQGIGNIKSIHKYFVPYRFKKDKLNRLVFLSEFGGYSLLDLEHSFSTKETGYRSFKNSDDLTAAIVRLFEKEIIPAIKGGLAGSVYTQLSDVETEVNGLLTYDRQRLKIIKKDIVEMNKRLFLEFVQSEEVLNK